LSPGTEWPTYKDRPLEFLMLLDLADMRGLQHGLPLSDAGLLNFFYDAEGD
jgi:uncharacterized protein YwqG